MNKSIKMLAAAFGLIAGTHAMTGQALLSNQCEVTIPANSDVSNGLCQPSDANKQARVNINDINNNGNAYDYQIKLTKGTVAGQTTGIGVLLDANSDRVLKAGGGQCQTCNDGPGVDALFGNIGSCILQTPDSATKFRVGINA